ncbi:MAG TPA: hypothetical protein VF911_14970 [Thermoanaerobaculia bacterium]|jgi:hypothetical protein
MKRMVSFAAIFLFLACASTSTSNASENHARARSDRGEVLIFSDAPDRVVIAIDTLYHGADGMVDQWFVLQTQGPSADPGQVHFGVADIRYREGVLRIISPTERVVYEFAVANETMADDVPAGFRRVLVEGYGLSHNVGETTVAVGTPGRGKPGCEECQSLNQDWGDAGDTGGGGEACNAGGANSTSCSYSSGTRSCQVTCGAGSYSCCKVTTTGVVCKCIPS